MWCGLMLPSVNESKQVKLFPNNKSWVNKSVKSWMEEKRHVFKQGSVSELHKASNVLKFEILNVNKWLQTSRLILVKHED